MQIYRTPVIQDPRVHGEPPAVIGHPDAATTSHLPAAAADLSSELEQWAERLNRLVEDAETRSEAFDPLDHHIDPYMARLAGCNSEAFFLHLSQVQGRTLDRTRYALHAARLPEQGIARNGSLRAPGADLMSTSKIDDLVEKFETAMKASESGMEREAAAAKGYLDYYSALNELLTELQGKAGYRFLDGDNNHQMIDGEDIVAKVYSFIRERREIPIARTATLEQAHELAAIFKAGSVTTRQALALNEDGVWRLEYQVIPSFSSLRAVVDCVAHNLNRSDGKDGWTKLFDTWIGGRNYRLVPWEDYKQTDAYKQADPAQLYRSAPAAVIQSFSLTVDDVRKTHSTDSQFVIDRNSRSLTKHNSFVEMFVSFMESMNKLCQRFYT